MKKNSESVVITIEDAAQQLGVSRQSGYEAARRGEIPTIRIGRRILVPKKRFEEFLDGTWIPAQRHDQAS